MVTAETIYNNLIGDWEVDYQFEHIVDGVVDQDRGLIRDWMFSFSEDSKLTIFYDPIFDPSNTICIDILISESLDQIIFLGEDGQSISIPDRGSRAVSFYNVLERNMDTQIWESILFFENEEMEQIKWHTKLNLQRI